MTKAVENGFSGIRLYQPDVYEGRFNWKKWLGQAVEFLRKQKGSCWIIQDIPVYAAHISDCKEAGIIVHLLN
jgi:hypothetical protein